MDPKTLELEKNHLELTIIKLRQAKSYLEKSMEQMGNINLTKLKNLREDPQTELHDLLLFMEMLHEQNVAFNFKDKYKRLEEIQALIDESYFARIDLEGCDEKYQKYYIGKFGYTENIPVIIDWRAKISSVYYRYRYPQKNVKYDTPDGPQTRDLKLKRTFEIDKSNLIKFYNNDIYLDENEIISDKISKRTGGVLEDIVETIQISQLDIIEADPRQICIVQGCVGSGKSTVAIHKLSHIFFNYSKLIHPERAILIAKNQILVGYLSTLFPKLGIFDVNYKTLWDLVYNLVFRENLKINVDMNLPDNLTIKLNEIRDIRQKIESIHAKYEIELNNLFENPEFKTFGGYKYNNNQSVYSNFTDIIDDLQEELILQKEIVSENPNSLRADFHKTNIKILKRIINNIKKIRLTIKETAFFTFTKELGIPHTKKMNYTETLLYVFVYSEVIGIKNSYMYEYCVVDEGQDLSILEYLVLNKLVINGRLCILGDLNQSYSNNAIENWEDIQTVIKEAKKANVFKLDTNYRSTKPIIDLANKILSPYTKNYLPKSINRCGKEPKIEYFSTNNGILHKFGESLKNDLLKLDKSIGIITFDTSLSNEIKLIVKNYLPKDEDFIVLDANNKIKYVPKGVYFSTFEECKGLEFSKVYIIGLNPDKISDFLEAKKAFVSVTRAMNELVIYSLV